MSSDKKKEEKKKSIVNVGLDILENISQIVQKGLGLAVNPNPSPNKQKQYIKYI